MISAVVMDDLLLNFRKYGSIEWIGAAMGIGFWCKTIGFADLIPEDFRRLVDPDNH